MDLSRRALLGGALGSATLLGTAACAGPKPGTAAGTSASAGAKASPTGPLKGTLTFAFWGGSDGETKGFTYLKQKFEAANPGTTVQLKVVPYDGFFAGIDRGLQAGNAPDVFRVDYTNIGKYSSKNVLVDMTPYFTDAEVAEFLPALWDAVKYQGKAYGVPHQTDTTAIVYDKGALAAAGVASVPDTPDSAWTWEEFADVAKKLRSTLPADKFPFAYAWTRAGAYRWLSWLYQAGGSLLTPQLDKAAIPSAEAAKALDFTKGFFTDKWVPASNTVKGSRYSDEFFVGKTVPMAFVGDFLVPTLADPKAGYKGDWGVTFMPRDKGAASDLGGNALVANAATKSRDLAAAFLKFAASEDQMKYFCEQAIELPTRKSLASASLQYATKPELVKFWAQQATTVTEQVVKESTVPAFNTINTVLQDQLEAAFVSGQATDQTLQKIADGVNAAGLGK
jgi:multiple sugar transport system substrate-binding protein